MELKSDSILITGVGMVSPLGQDVITSCAAARAGITRPTELAYFTVFDEESATAVPIVGHAISEFSEGFFRFGRLVRLGDAALANLIADARLQEGDFSRTGMFLNLSSGHYLDLAEKKERKLSGEPELNENDPDYEPYETEVRKYHYAAGLISRLSELNGIKIQKRFQKVFFGDHAGLISAINDAVSLMRNRDLEQCIVGGIDSLIEPDILEALNQVGVLKTPINPAGFIPGEASAFFLLETYANAERRKAKIQGVLTSSSTLQRENMERNSDRPSFGEGLSGAILQILDNLPSRGSRVGWVAGSLNGDPWRVQEWGNTLVRISTRHSIDRWVSWFPASSFGETGAATGAVCFCVAIRGFARDYIKGDVLIALSNEDGNKGAACLGKI